MDDTRNRRRLLVVNKAVQRRIIFAVIIVPTIGLAISTMIVSVFCRRLLTESLQLDAELPSLIPLLLAVLLFFVICSIVMAIQGLRFSHRIAGPSYRICKSLERMRSGDIAFRVTLRKGDYLTEVADEFNATLDWLNQNPPANVRTGGDVVEVLRASDDTDDDDADADAEARVSEETVRI
jgi:hypothetical protein